MKRMAFVTTLTALISTNVQADTVGLYIGGQIWQSESSGVMGEKRNLANFDLKNKQQVNYFIAVEHPFPIVPNARLSSTSLDTSGRTSLVHTFNFDDETFSSGDEINANFNVSYFDYTLYYELIDSDLFSFEVGVSARDFNGDVTVNGTASSSDDTCNDPNPSPDSPCSGGGDPVIPTGKIKTSGIEPMLYTATNVALPVRGLKLFAQGSLSLSGNHSLHDYQIGFSYNFIRREIGNFDLTLGYQVVKMEFEDFNKLYSDLEFKGTFIGVLTHF